MPSRWAHRSLVPHYRAGLVLSLVRHVGVGISRFLRPHWAMARLSRRWADKEVAMRGFPFVAVRRFGCCRRWGTDRLSRRGRFRLGATSD